MFSAASSKHPPVHTEEWNWTYTKVWTDPEAKQATVLFVFVSKADGTLYQQKGDVREVNLKCWTAISEPYYLEDNTCIYSPILDRFS